MRASSARTPQIGSGLDVGSLTSAMAAALLGIFIVLGAGFAPIEAVHNAMHDTRHVAAFPCH